MQIIDSYHAFSVFVSHLNFTFPDYLIQACLHLTQHSQTVAELAKESPAMNNLANCVQFRKGDTPPNSTSVLGNRLELSPNL